MASVFDTYLENGLLAQASYADLYPGILFDDYIDALKDTGASMTQVQAEEFASTYQIIASQPNTINGFSATVFYNTDTEKYTLAIRGTEADSVVDAVVDWTEDLSNIGGNGTALEQGIDLFNFN
ncbi:MAG: hypothetical protein PVJ78_07315 [Gammaproteobacteria bacterium]|jgi:hypothetical protein